MDKKARMGLSALLIIGIVYAVLGAVFTALGICLQIALADDAALIGMIFAGIGSLFLVLGIIFLAVESKKRRRANALLNAGRYIWGEVVDLVPNYNVRINSRHPYIVMVRYADPTGTVHIFRSQNLRTYPDRSILGRQVKVYVETDSYKHYYVDLDGVLPNVIEH